MKNTLSIGEIKRILQNVYLLEDYNEEMLEEIYKRYLEIKELERQEACGMIEGFLERWQFDIEKDDDFFTFLLGLSAWSSYLKNMVQALLEARYPDLDAEKKIEEQQKKEESKQQKEEKKAAAKAAKKEEKAKKEPSKKQATEVPEKESD